LSSPLFLRMADTNPEVAKETSILFRIPMEKG